jgi:uncharacterized metal-binding protein YceD (DUF177 family)
MIDRASPERSAKAGGKKSDRQSAQPAPPWSVPIVVAEVPDTGRSLAFAPDEAQREAIAAAADILALPRFEATFDLTRHGADSLRVVGHVSAKVIQRCVVTLDPVENEIDEDVDLLFQPQAEAPRAPAPDTGHQGLESAEPPEVLHGDVVDVGAVATEFLLLAIDPYPRKPGAVFEAPPAGDPASHPFAALAALKKDGGKKGP